jgi:hypothetical protein
MTAKAALQFFAEIEQRSEGQCRGRAQLPLGAAVWTGNDRPEELLESNLRRCGVKSVM